MIDDTPLETAIAQGKLPGAVAMLSTREGETYARAFGMADATTGRPMAVDTPFQIASMTKAIVSVGVMHLVERGALSLDAPIGTVLPDLADNRVLTGFAADGTPQLRPASRPITLRHLLTHTAGLGYAFVQPEVLCFYQATGMPAPGSRRGITMPLLFDPGEQWAYSVATDWIGLAIEAATGSSLGVYLAEHVFQPLGMDETGFLRALPDNAARVHVRNPEGGLGTIPMFLGGGEFESGGGGLISTAPDYTRFVRMILRGGELDGARVLKTETVDEMSRNQVAPLKAGAVGTSMPEFATAFDPFPEQHSGWGLGFLINPDQGRDGRSPGSLSWAGIFNSYYWIDPKADVAGVFMAQMAPFADAGALGAYAALEQMAYA
ncbi:serine hydrolase domain-containing protein [Novosphingobium sp.]|uniref:serine hydrolase domain-containing protein n=1 Tax=Novosphingobium sp. TaxID=1874826 RepID=UPI0025F36919|nr:serine hydrolase domain-containing protein [Novosphingobium sp.]